MQLWSQTDVSFVDFADGYSYLSFMPINFGVRTDEIKPEDASVIFHEFTHQLALKGPFGWLCAYFQALRPIGRIFSELQANIEFPELFSHADQERNWGQLISLETFYELYGDCIANYFDLINSHRWLLEGIALFVQFDFTLSAKFDVASEVFHFAAELVKTERFRGEGILTVSDVSTFIDEARNSKSQSGLLQIFLENTKPETAPYFMGYLMVKQIQRILAAKDVRLNEPELFYIFMQGYFFRDRKVVELYRVRPRQEYQHVVSDFIQQRVLDLLNVDCTRLELLVDSICDFSNSPVHPDLLDFAHLLRRGEFVRWVDVDVVRELDAKLVRYSQQLEQLPVFANYHNDNQFQEYIGIAVETARFLFHVLRNIMLTFKMKHIHRAILGYQPQPNGFVLVTSIGVHGTPISLMESIPAEEFVPILQEVEKEKYEIARNDGPRMPKPMFDAFKEAEWDRFFDMLWNYYEQGKLLIVQDYDIYLMMGRERCRVWVRGDFLRVVPYHWRPDASSDHITSEEDLEMLKSIGRFFHHGEYLRHIQIPQLIGGPSIKQDNEFNREVLLQIWRLIYTDCSASRKELDAFASQKAKIVAVTKVERQFLRSLCYIPHKQVGVSDGVFEALNRRWKHFTGRDLIKIKASEDGLSAELDL